MSKASADIFDKLGSFDNLSVKERVNKLRDTFLSILKPASQSGTATKTACADMLALANKLTSLNLNKPAVSVKVTAMKSSRGRFRNDMLENKSKRYEQKRKAEESLFQLDKQSQKKKGKSRAC